MPKSKKHGFVQSSPSTDPTEGCANLQGRRKEDILREVMDVLFREHEITADEVEMVKNALHDVYREGFRHEYSSLTGYMLQKQTENAHLIDVFHANIDYWRDNLVDAYPEEPEYKKGVLKLLDHISLEAARSAWLSDIYTPTIEAEKRLAKSLEQAEKDLAQAKHSIEKQKMDFIAILGLFSGVILAFVGGITFSNSALAGIARVSIHRLVCVICLCGLVLVNTIATVMQFIAKIVFVSEESKLGKNAALRWINLLFVAIFLLICVAYCAEFYLFPLYFTH